MNKNTTRGLIIGGGVLFIVLSVVILAAGVWEIFGGSKNRMQMIQVPGFHQLELSETGLYGGVYQHRSQAPIPVKQLSQLDVRILYKPTYAEVPVVMNTQGMTFNRFGLKGMPLFNFMAHEPGTYTLSADYRSGTEGPVVPVMIISQAAQNIKQTLIVGVIFFALFLGLGILMLIKVNDWAPKKS